MHNSIEIVKERIGWLIITKWLVAKFVEQGALPAQLEFEAGQVFRKGRGGRSKRLEAVVAPGDQGIQGIPLGAGVLELSLQQLHILLDRVGRRPKQTAIDDQGAEGCEEGNHQENARRFYLAHNEYLEERGWVEKRTWGNRF
jgi:hypothetical protein